MSLNSHSNLGGDFDDSNGNYSPQFLNAEHHLLRVTQLIKGRDESQLKLPILQTACVFHDTTQLLFYLCKESHKGTKTRKNNTAFFSPFH